ncbi:MAG: hypothetical protein R3F11_03905 [Verrucomicrobiales bacterium]
MAAPLDHKEMSTLVERHGDRIDHIRFGGSQLDRQPRLHFKAGEHRIR